MHDCKSERLRPVWGCGIKNDRGEKFMNKNVPNIITLSRVFLTPIMIVFFLLPMANGVGKFIAFGIYVVGSLTDAVDGHLARKYNLVSNIGKMLDSIADKFIQTSAIILVLAGTNVLPVWASVTILLVLILRDIYINAVRQICLTNGVVVAADFWGKLKSIFIDVATSVLMFYVAISAVVTSAFVDLLLLAGISILIVGVALSVISCINYTVNSWGGITGKTKNQQKTE